MIRTFLLTVAMGVLAAGVSSADVLETFDYPVQTDSVGSGGLFRITETGGYTPADGVVASFSEGLSTGAGVATDFVEFYANLDINNGSGFTPGASVFLGIMDIPGFGFANQGGPFGTFFSSPKDLTNAIGSVDLRLVTFGPAASMRMMALDAGDNEVFTDTSLMSIGSFTTHNFETADFVFGDVGTFDETQVVGLGIEFFINADDNGNTAIMDVNVDNLYLQIIPEPGSGILVGGFLVLAGLRRRRG